jgi:hypothetical protein
MRLKRITSCFLRVIAVGLAVASTAEPQYWAEAMKAVHALFKGNSGYVAQFGDSIIRHVIPSKACYW